VGGAVTQVGLEAVRLMTGCVCSLSMACWQDFSGHSARRIKAWQAPTVACCWCCAPSSCRVASWVVSSQQV
jgi:hypothetical protein